MSIPFPLLQIKTRVGNVLGNGQSHIKNNNKRFWSQRLKKVSLLEILELWELLTLLYSHTPLEHSLEFPTMSVFGVISKFCKGFATFRQNNAPLPDTRSHLWKYFDEMRMIRVWGVELISDIFKKGKQVKHKFK